MVKQAVQALWEGGNFSDWTGDLLRVFETGGIKSMADQFSSGPSTASVTPPLSNRPNRAKANTNKIAVSAMLFGLFESGGVTEAVLGPLLNWADQSWKGTAEPRPVRRTPE